MLDDIYYSYLVLANDHGRTWTLGWNVPWCMMRSGTPSIAWVCYEAELDDEVLKRLYVPPWIWSLDWFKGAGPVF
jgi:hypothetical protein